jgi:hypothetical protein
MSYSVTAPDMLVPIFNPAIFRVKGLTNSATLVIECGDITFADMRHPLNGVVEWDISPYLHTLFADFKKTRERQKYFTVSITERGDLTDTTVMSEDQWLALYAYSSPVMPLGTPLRQIYYRSFPKMKQVFTLMSGDYDPVSTPTGRYDDAFRESWQGFKDFSYADIYQAEDASDVYVHYFYEDGVKYPFKTDESTCGVMLKWLNAQGFYCYFLMQEGEKTTTTKDAGERLTMVVGGDMSVGASDGSVSEIVTIPQGVETSLTLKLCATFCDEQDRALLDTIFNAPLVWIVNKDNGKEMPVSIKRGSRSTAKGLQDYEIEVQLPSPPKMML